MTFRLKVTFTVCIFLASISFADLGIQTTNPDLKLDLDGKGWVESGQFVDYFIKDKELYHTWINKTFLDLKFDAVYKERLKISLGMEGRMWFNSIKPTGTGQATYRHRENADYIVSDANGKYSWGNVDNSYLSLTLGLFPYKYNNEARNLGEYLFRTGTYPGYIINNFDLAFARLTGLKISSDIGNGTCGHLHQDLMYTIETTIPPFYDGTVTYLADYNYKKIFDVGLSGSYDHLVSVNEALTTPKTSENRYIEGNDTGYYTFRGLKLMGKAFFDPKRFIPASIFGEEDMKIYTEIAILGLKNYPKNDTSKNTSSTKNIYGYDTLKNRIPIMIGFNVPTFKILNVLALECEWYRCPYPNSYKNREGEGKSNSYPVPDYVNRSNVDYSADNWKWSVYAKKTILNDHLGIILQFARDHIRTESLVDESWDYEEALSLNKQWYWMMKLEAKF
jgi:hypothetical protein